MAEENSEDADYQLALRLHKRLNGDTEAKRSKEDEELDLQFAKNLQAELLVNDGNDTDSSFQFDYPGNRKQQASPKVIPKGDTPSRPIANDDYLNQTQHLVHPEWELVDPSPDVFSMFQRFDAKFFQNRLGAVVLEWSKRMYSCAGICYQRSNRFTKEVTIRLSEPLLKLRPRKDLVETLLHEMIHAYFFTLNVHEGNGGHGPNFKQKMTMINKVAGTNITVYHTFHDEVNAYRTHIWRCTGICQNHTPFHGLVKRTSNRAPGPSDQWWAKHQRECAGTFMKISEPSKPPPKVTKPSKKAPALPPVVTDPKQDIRKWMKKPPAKKPAKGVAPKGTVLPTLIADPMAIPFTMPRTGGPPKSRPQSTGSNIMSFGDLNRSNSDSEENEPPKKRSRQRPTFNESDHGYSMPTAASGKVQDIREMREKRFGQQQKLPSKRNQNTSEPKGGVTKDADAWESYDDDVMVRDAPEVVIDLLADSGTEDEQETQGAAAPVTKPKKTTKNDKGKKKDKGKKPKRDSRPSSPYGEEDSTDSDDIVEPNYIEDINEAGEVMGIYSLEDSSNEYESRKRRRDSEIEHWESLNDDVVNLADDTDSEEEKDDFKRPSSTVYPMSSQERSAKIKQEVLEDESNVFEEDDIVFIDGEYNDDEAAEADSSSSLANNPEDMAGENSLLSEFRLQNDVMPSCSRSHNVDNDIVSCPICFDKLKRCELSNHLDGCSITVRVAPPTFKSKGPKVKAEKKPTKDRKGTTLMKQRLLTFGYTNEEVAALDLSTSSTSSSSSMQASEGELTPRQLRQRNLFKPTVGCPKCGMELMGHQLEAHRRLCHGKKSKKSK